MSYFWPTLYTVDNVDLSEHCKIQSFFHYNSTLTFVTLLQLLKFIHTFTIFCPVVRRGDTVHQAASSGSCCVITNRQHISITVIASVLNSEQILELETASITKL